MMSKQHTCNECGTGQATGWGSDLYAWNVVVPIRPVMTTTKEIVSMNDISAEEQLTKTMLGQLIAEIVKFGGWSNEQASQLATILLPYVDQYVQDQTTTLLNRLLEHKHEYTPWVNLQLGQVSNLAVPIKVIKQELNSIKAGRSD